MQAARDKALLLIGFAGAFLRSELVGLRIEDVTTYDTGLEIVIRRSKTDQEGGGRTVFIPAAKRKTCPVKAAIRRVGGDDAASKVAGHSLRAGYCTEAATVGLQLYQIREQTGHKSDVTLARYIRPVAKRKIPSLL